MNKYLEAGKIINKRGLKGELKVESYCDSDEVFCSVKEFFADKDGKISYKVLSAKTYNGYIYLMLDGINTPELADSMRNKSLYAKREDIPVDEGKVFIDDILGLPVYDADTGREYGRITDVFNRGASDIYAISDGEKEYLIPAVPEFIIETDTENGIKIRPIPGMFDEAEQV